MQAIARPAPAKPMEEWRDSHGRVTKQRPGTAVTPRRCSGVALLVEDRRYQRNSKERSRQAERPPHDAQLEQ
jgi:hypothetical protein